jgi:hypothetical protein
MKKNNVLLILTTAALKACGGCSGGNDAPIF